MANNLSHKLIRDHLISGKVTLGRGSTDDIMSAGVRVLPLERSLLVKAIALQGVTIDRQ